MTIVAYDRLCLFGAVIDGAMFLNDAGREVARTWSDLPAHYAHVELDAFVVMPNHLHGVIVLTESDAGPKGDGGGDRIVAAGFKPAMSTAARHGLPEIIRALKTFSGRRINAARGMPGRAVWQRSYFDHINRDEADLDRIRGYIDGNPRRWDEDAENPGRVAPEGRHSNRLAASG
ncbi:MAG: transposase [Dehalococcoidia bacterium]|nr:transposase [Dehalococcoidia bacterium]